MVAPLMCMRRTPSCWEHYAADGRRSIREAPVARAALAVLGDGHRSMSGDSAWREKQWDRSRRSNPEPDRPRNVVAQGRRYKADRQDAKTTVRQESLRRKKPAKRSRPQAAPDRTLLLADAERLQDFDHAGGVRASLPS